MKRRGAGDGRDLATSETLDGASLPGLSPGTQTGRPTSVRPNLFAAGAVVAEQYEIIRLIGSGGMGQVYEARDQRLNRRVAIKVAHPDIGGAALLEEAQALAAFRHPGLVTVHAVGRDGGFDYLVMELLNAVTLAEQIFQRGTEQPFSLAETIDIMLGISDALSVLHNASLAHRDLKPENIMLAPRGRIVLLDLGIVRQERHIQKESHISGSPLYIAPETVLGAVKMGEAHLVDVYALGVIGFEMLTGQVPFDATELMDLFMEHVNRPPPVPSQVRPGTSTALDRLIGEMLAKSPEDRPASIELVIAELRSIRAALSRPVAARPLDVLIVDDDADMRAVTEAIVLDAVPSARIRFAHDGAQALRSFQQRPPDVMFLDLQMPVMGGLEVCMYLRGTSLADNTSIVVLSAHADANQALLAQLGVADVLAKKDAGLTALAERLRTYLLRLANAHNRATRPSATR